jgi:hypothetical protein
MCTAETLGKYARKVASTSAAATGLPEARKSIAKIGSDEPQAAANSHQ